MDSVSGIRGMRRFWSVVLFALVIASSSQSIVLLPQGVAPPQSQKLETTALLDHAPIVIVGDAGFLGYNSSTGIRRGSGTAADPYMIEGWNIDAHAMDDGISISDTVAYFEIVGCYVYDSSVSGILLSGVSNGTLSNNYCSGNQYGIRLGQSYNNVIRDNNCTANVNGGICLLDSHGNSISGNDCNGNQCGIGLTSSDDKSLADNRCTGNYNYGIALVSSRNNSIVWNVCYDNECGIDLHGSDSNLLVNNTCNENAIYGIALMASDSNKILNSTCFHDQYGIDLHRSDRNVLRNNSCSNDQHGIWLGYSFNNSVINSTCSIDQFGISLLSSCNNTVYKNICLSNALTGVSLDSSNNNTLSENICTGNLYGIDLVRLKNKDANQTDYYFYKIDQTYYARDNRTGLVVRSSTDARVVIQNVIDSLGTDPARFFFDDGEYIIKSSGMHEWIYYPNVIWEIGINVYKQITMICDGTTFKAASGLLNPFMIFYIYDANYVEIRGAHIDCNQAGQSPNRWVVGIFTRRADWLLVENCEIEHFGGYAIFIDVNSSFPTIRCNYVHNSANDEYSHGIAFHNNGEEGLIFGNRIEDIGNNRYAILVDSIDKVRVIGNTIGDSDGVGISVTDDADETLLMGNWITRQNYYHPSILVAECSNTQIIGNYLFGNKLSSIFQGPIKVDALTNGTVIKNNYMDNAGIIDYANDTVISGNYGYLIEEGPCEFIVDFDGSNYRAENATGVLKHSSSNFSELMESVVAGATSGSKIVFREGTYVVQGSGLGAAGRYFGIRINKTLQFEGEGATFVMADAVDRDYSVVLVDGADYVRIRGIAFDVNSDGQEAHSPAWSGCGVQMVGSIRPIIQKCDFYDFNYLAISVDGRPGSQTALDCFKEDYRTFSRNTVYGIMLSYSCNDNTVLRNNCSDSTGYGLSIADTYSSGNRITNNTLFRTNCSGEVYEVSHIQAYDGGVANLWNTSGLIYNYGNYWSDWRTPDDVIPYGIVDYPYGISGAAGRSDCFPLTIPVAPTLNLIPPILIPDLIGTQGTNGWYVSAVQVPFVSAANLTDYGIFHMYYRLDAGAFMDYETSMTITTNGTHAIEFYTVDIAGNLIHVKSFAFKIDTQPPYQEITLFGVLSPTIWYLTNLTFNIVAHDYFSGFNLTRYRVDGGDWQIEDWHEYNISFTLTDGIHSVEYTSKDNASNEEPVKTLIIRIDTGAPYLSITAPTGSIKDANATISWDSGDNNSGIARYEIVVDGNPPIVAYNDTHRLVLNLPNGMHTVLVRAIDAAGNSAEQQITFSVDLETSKPPDQGQEMTILLLAVVIIGSIMLYFMLKRSPRSQQK